ncbi:MAG: efflux RND transporter periplasmic adaptor subunit [Winogradskyella sp.]
MYRKLLLIITLTVLLNCEDKPNPNATMVPKVQVVELQTKEVSVYKDFVGQVYGYKDIPIRTRVEGYLEGMYFQEGNFVSQGDLLYVVDPNPLKEAFNAAQSELARAEINRDKAISDFNRIEPLAKINAVSQRDLDAAVAQKEGTQQMVEAARAQIRLAQINLGYASIEAPVSGVIGKTQAQVGEFVGRSPNPVILNTVSTIDSLRVEFFITEGDYLAWTKKSKGQADLNNELQLVLSDGSVFPYKGKVKFINREVDAVTGTLLIQSIFPNPDRIVRPGQFARVRAEVNTIADALLVPQRCVSEVQGVFNVMRINDEGKAERVNVKLGEPYMDYYIVEEGLSSKDKVIFEGLQRAKNGAQVEMEVVDFKSQVKAQ